MSGTHAPALLPVRDRILSGLAHSIGNTPLLAIRCVFRGRTRTIYAKCEHLNLTGSIKDRMALYVLRTAYQKGTLGIDDTIVEVTSGNTGISFAALGRALGHPVRIFMPDWMSMERRALIASFGAEVVPVSKAQGGFLGALALAEEAAARDPHVFLPRQFDNEANVEAHASTTGPEICQQLASRGLSADAFVAGVGTGGTVMGVGRYLRSCNDAVRIHPVEPLESPTLTTGCKVGQHRIQGISDEFIPALLQLQELDDVIQVSDGDAILMAQALAGRLGLGVGISSGANLIAGLVAQEALGPDAVVATVFPDDNKKYVSTALFGHEPVQPAYITPGVELLRYDVITRSCAFCGGNVGRSEIGDRTSAIVT
jgi:cysteine synthase A